MAGSMIGKVALVTGGSQGIGRAAAFAFAAEGASVVVASRAQAAGEAVVAAIQESEPIKQAGGEACWVQADVSRSAQVDGLMHEIIRAYGRLDYAFNNAGSGGKGGWLAEIEEEDWDQTIDGYLKSVYLCMKAEIKVMLEQIGEHHGPTAPCAIVNNSSVDGQRAFPWDPVYSAAKHGVLGLTKSAAIQYIQKGIRINAVCPGWIMTPATEGLMNDPESLKHALSHQPIGRMGTAEEVAQAVIWLCSEKASLIVGTALAVDGAYLAV